MFVDLLDLSGARKICGEMRGPFIVPISIRSAEHRPRRDGDDLVHELAPDILKRVVALVVDAWLVANGKTVQIARVMVHDVLSDWSHDVRVGLAFEAERVDDFHIRRVGERKKTG